MPLKIDTQSHPYTKMSEDFLLRQATAELALLGDTENQSEADHAALNRVLWNWLMEYDKHPGPTELKALVVLVKEFVSGAVPSPAPAIKMAKGILNRGVAQ